ncbi:MAG: ABC transporter substrate-binding protein [Deltaproteobacteria bacterium]|nr:ABC transporter substrate-binding protein [Deltaproteobacteria bacterium]MDQ3298344.1 ABC transporter substrate-binding protein [Myxococcota bacterium]
MRRDSFGCAVAMVMFAGCSTVFEPQQCAVDKDCGGGLVCELRGGDPVCVHPEDAPLVIGQSAPISGTNQALGTGMKLGIELAFEEQNALGGIRGRKLELDFRDDAYTPELAEQAARVLVDAKAMTTAPRCPTTTTPAVAGQEPISSTGLERGPKAVLAVLGSVGTPTMVRSAPVVIETGTIFFGAFTGASTILRDDKAATCRSYIFNVRASYAQEARATMEFFKKRGVVDHRHVISFDQNDSFGQAGYDGLVQGYKEVIGPFPGSADPTTPIVRFRYTRNDDASVPAQADAAESYLASLLTGNTSVHNVGIMMTDTYGAGAQFIHELRTWQYANDSQQGTLDKANRLKLHFSNVSFVGPNALSERLVALGSVATPSGQRPFTDSVLVSQVVPNYQSDSSEVIASYNRLIAMKGVQPGFTSLEGYISTRVFIAGLLAHQGPFTPDALVKTLEQLPDLSLGLGASSGFSPANHQYSNSVWGTIIEPDGSFRNLYFWSQGQPIQFFE